MLAGRILDPVSKLAAARALSPDTASFSLGEALGLGEVDEAELYAGLDWLLERRAAIETALAKRHLQNGRVRRAFGISSGVDYRVIEGWQASCFVLGVKGCLPGAAPRPTFMFVVTEADVSAKGSASSGRRRSSVQAGLRPVA